jgi:UDP-N-acetylglucosamine--N-acetylmuramyl-(pentapeptide) pyrophosphoryl-undecaprenol N-acetylglucosamine transferase
VIAAGGTAGHVLPALAVADELRSRGVRVTFAGSPDRVEARLVPDAGYEIDFFRISGLPRRLSPDLARAALRALRAPRECLRILERRLPSVVLGAGSYVGGPMVLAAWRKKIPAAVSEADAHLGLANRLAARFARRVYLAYDRPDRSAPKYRVVGRPVRAVPAVAREEARRRFELPADGRALLVLGGSQGAAALNEAALASFAEEGPPLLHICGDRYYGSLRERPRRGDYRLLPWTDELGTALAAADLALARAGGSVWEIAAAGVPAVLVPSPNVTADHQTKNARHFERGGGAVVLPESELAQVGDVVGSLLDDGARLASMRDAMRRLAKPEAAREIADDLLELARR